jgi:DDE superfamily endonuclease
MIRRSWSGYAPVEATLEVLASALRDVKGRMRQLFAQERTAVNAGLFLDGLLSEEQRKTGWMRSEAAGDAGPWRQQELLGRDRWNADALRDLVREYVVEHLRDDDAVLVIDETGFLKQGKASCGVARQYTGSAGKITNCQIGVFATYVSRHGHAFIDRALYLPKSWADDPLRLKATYVPNDIGFATKPRLAMWMIARAVASGVPFSWVAADSVMALARSRVTSGAWGKATCSASLQLTYFDPGARSGCSQVPLPRLLKRLTRPIGSACRQEKARKGRDCMTGATSNSPILMQTNSMKQVMDCGHAAC